MDFVNLDRQIEDSRKRKIRNAHLFEASNFRSWLLYFEPGDGTDMHYHLSPETFLVIDGEASLKGINGEKRIVGKNEVVFLPAKEYYQITNIGTGPLVLFGNRSESFGKPHVRVGQEKS